MAEILLTHFWLFCGIWVGGLGALQWHSILAKHVRSGALDDSARKQFVKGWFVAIMIPSLLLWLIQLSAGPAITPEYPAWPSPYKWIALVINIVCWLILIWWVWMAGGARYLSGLLTLKANRLETWIYSEYTVKCLSLLLLVSGVSGLSQAQWSQ